MCIRDSNRVEEQLIELSNGCICCTLREDLLLEVGKLARAGRFDYLLIESTGISEPLPVAETFTFEDESGLSLGEIAKLDTMVTVVDALNFLHDFNAVSYTHLDVYKRQPHSRSRPATLGRPATSRVAIVHHEFAEYQT